MLRLVLPVLAEQLLAMLIGFSDTLLTGHYLDQPHLAAINLMAYVLWLLHGTFAVVAIGAMAMVARFVGAKDFRTARLVTNQALLIGAVLAVVMTLAGAALGKPAVWLMQLRGEAGDLAVRYFFYVLPILPLVMIETVGIASLRGAGDMVSGLVVMTIVNLVNIALSWALCLGLGPLPRLGWDGLAIGTACGYACGGLIVVALLLRGRSGLRIGWPMLRPDWDLMRRVLRIGLPGGADTLSVIGCQLWFVSVINQMGDLAAAAHGVAIRVESLAFLPGVAFQMAAATMAGQYLGARDYRKAGRSVLVACLFGGGVMVTAGLAFLTQAPAMAQLFLGEGHAGVAQQAAPLLRTISMAMPALALVMILSGALRGAGDTRWPLLFSLIGFLGVRIPAAYWLSFSAIQWPGTELCFAGWGLGVLGAWYAMVIDLWVRAVLVVYRFMHGGWKRIDV